MADVVKIGIRLFIITAIAALALGLTNAYTSEPIRLQQELAAFEAKVQVLPQAVEFKLIDIEKHREKFSNILAVNEGYANNEKMGYTFRVLSTGFADMQLYIGIDNTGIITGVYVVEHRETPGLGTRATNIAFTEQFVALSALDRFELVRKAERDNEIQAVSGATVSSTAILDAVNFVVEFYTSVLKEGEE